MVDAEGMAKILREKQALDIDSWAYKDGRVIITLRMFKRLNK